MNTKIIKFHEEELLAVEVNEGWYVAVKPIIDAIGLHADSAVKGIKNDEILGSSHAIYHVLDASGRQFPMVCLPIQHVHGWLFSIQAAKVKPEAREKLKLYKLECYQVLFNHFYGKQRQITVSLEERYKLGQYLKKLDRLISRLMKRHKEVKVKIKAIDEANYAQLELFDSQLKLN